MANVKISALTSLSSVADSTTLPVVDSGTNYKITASQIKTYMGLGNVSLINKDGNASNVLYGNGVFGSLTSSLSSYALSSSLGNLSVLNKDGNASNVLYGNGVFSSLTSSLSSYVTSSSLTTTLSSYALSSSLGNLSVLNKDGNASNILYGNGVFASAPSAGTTYGNSNVATFLASFGSNTISTTGNLTAGNIIISGATTTGVNSILAGPTFTPLANTMAGFVSNVNNYTQLTIQNKSTGADATTDFIATADNGSDTVNYLDLGIVNSGYDNLTPTNSLGNIVYAADSYLYAQGNSSATSQSGGNLAIGTAVVGKTVKIFAGGVTASNIVATIANTGVTVVGNVTATKFVGDGSSLTNITVTAAGNIVGTSSNVSLVAGSFTATFDNTGVLTLPTNGGDEGGELRLGVPATNTTLQNRVTVDVYQDRLRIFEGSGSTKGAYIDLSQAATGVSTLLNNRVGATSLALDTSLTFDNLKIQIKAQGSGVWIFAGTVSGTATYQYSITYQLSATSTTGTVGNMSATTTVAAIGTTGWWFGAAASTATTIITDTTNSKMYRITWMTTTGSSPYGNYVSIERLV